MLQNCIGRCPPPYSSVDEVSDTLPGVELVDLYISYIRVEQRIRTKAHALKLSDAHVEITLSNAEAFASTVKRFHKRLSFLLVSTRACTFLCCDSVLTSLELTHASKIPHIFDDKTESIVQSRFKRGLLYNWPGTGERVRLLVW